MAPETQTTDFNPTFLPLGPSLTLYFDCALGEPQFADGEVLSAAIKRVNLDDDEDEDDDEEVEDDDLDDDEEDEDEDEEAEDDEYEDDDEDDEDEDLDDEDDEDEDEDDIKLI